MVYLKSNWLLTLTGIPGHICPTDALFKDHVTVNAKDVIGNVIMGVADASCSLCVGTCPRTLNNFKKLGRWRFQAAPSLSFC